MKQTITEEMKMKMGAMYQALLMLLNAAGLTKGAKFLEEQWTKNGFDYTDNLEVQGKNLYAGSGGLTVGKHTLIRYLANTLGGFFGRTFYTEPKGKGGFNTNLAKSSAIAILHHVGITDAKGKILDRANFGKDANLFALKVSAAFIAPVEVDDEEDAFGNGDEDDEDEFADVEVVTASDKVTSFNALSAGAKADYPLATLFISFFEMIKCCGSAVGTVLDFQHVKKMGAVATNWRGDNGAKAIANGDAMYRNGAGKPKDIKCVTSFSKEKKIDNMFKAAFSYELVTPILLRSLGFNFGNRNKVFTHMVTEYFDGDAKAGYGFVTSVMRLIMNAVDNGAPTDEIGSGFNQYLDDVDIYALINKFTDGDFYDAIKSTGGDGSGSVIDASFDDVLA